MGLLSGDPTVTTGAENYGRVMASVGVGLANAETQAAAAMSEVWERFSGHLVTIIGPKADEVPDLAGLLTGIYRALLGMCALQQEAAVSLRTSSRSRQLERMLGSLQLGYVAGAWGGSVGLDYGRVTDVGALTEAGFEYRARTMQADEAGWSIVADTIAGSALPEELKRQASALVAAELAKLSDRTPADGILDLLPPAVRADYA